MCGGGGADSDMERDIGKELDTAGASESRFPFQAPLGSLTSPLFWYSGSCFEPVVVSILGRSTLSSSIFKLLSVLGLSKISTYHKRKSRFIPNSYFYKAIGLSNLRSDLAVRLKQ